MLYLAAQFIVCMLCHGELARSRPAARYLTAFYLTIAAGGALGGAFVALIAPRVFTEFSEYPIGLAGACLLGFVGWLRTGALREWTRSNLAVRLPLMALLIGGLTAIVATATLGKQGALASARNFYGILRVMERFDDNGAFRELQHGRTRHGIEYLAPAQRDWPTSYYGPHSGIAMALNALGQHRNDISPWLVSARARSRLGAMPEIPFAFTKSIRMSSRSRAPGFRSCAIPRADRGGSGRRAD